MHLHSITPEAQHPDVWAAGEGYEPYIGRWSRLVARGFIEWLNLPDGSRWLDVGCGTGALTQTILERASPAGIVAMDRSDPFIAYARRHVPDPRASFETGDAQFAVTIPGDFTRRVVRDPRGLLTAPVSG